MRLRAWMKEAEKEVMSAPWWIKRGLVKSDQRPKGPISRCHLTITPPHASDGIDALVQQRVSLMPQAVCERF
jgi:hypothetical protein